jgi:hypothetical protein
MAGPAQVLDDPPEIGTRVVDGVQQRVEADEGVLDHVVGGDL